MRGNAYGDFFSTKWAWVFLGEIATLEPCRESRREIATAAPRNDEKGKGGHLRICPYIIRKKKKDAWV